MRNTVVSFIILILLAVAVFSINPDSNNDSNNRTVPEKALIQENLTQKTDNKSNFSHASKNGGYFYLMPLEDTNLAVNSIKENFTAIFSGICRDGIFEEININKGLIKPSEPCTAYQTVVVNPARFRELASNGTVNLSLMGEDYELKLQDRQIQKTDLKSYMGYISGKPQSSCFFTVRNESIEGYINVDFFTLSYGITETNKSYNGKVIHLLCKYYSQEGDREIRKRYSLDPLEFTLRNNGKKNHEVSIELLDFYNKSLFKAKYSLKPGDEIFSPKINVEPAYYRYEIILDNTFTFEEKVRADYAAELGSSEKLHINLIEDPDNPIEFWIAVA